MKRYYATIPVIPNDRRITTERPVITFSEKPPGTPIPDMTLPVTLDTLPLLGLFGLIPPGGAFVVRLVAKRLH